MLIRRDWKVQVRSKISPSSEGRWLMQILCKGRVSERSRDLRQRRGRQPRDDENPGKVEGSKATNQKAQNKSK